MADGIEIPGFPAQFLGPTGKVFLHPKGQGFSTHLNMVTGDVPGLEGKHTLVPLLVPGQTNVQHLLKGGKPTAKQHKLAISWAAQHLKNGNQLASYNTPEEALAAEQSWHEQAAQAAAPFVAPFLRPAMSRFNRGGQSR